MYTSFNASRLCHGSGLYGFDVWRPIQKHWKNTWGIDRWEVLRFSELQVFLEFMRKKSLVQAQRSSLITRGNGTPFLSLF